MPTNIEVHTDSLANMDKGSGTFQGKNIKFFPQKMLQYALLLTQDKNQFLYDI